MTSRHPPVATAEPRLAPQSFPHIIDEILYCLPVRDLVTLTATSGASSGWPTKSSPVAQITSISAVGPFRGHYRAFASTITRVDDSAPLPNRFLKFTRILDDFAVLGELEVLDRFDGLVDTMSYVERLEIVRMEAGSDTTQRLKLLELSSPVKTVVIFVPRRWRFQRIQDFRYPLVPPQVVYCFPPKVLGAGGGSHIHDLCVHFGARDQTVLLNPSDCCKHSWDLLSWMLGPMWLDVAHLPSPSPRFLFVAMERKEEIEEIKTNIALHYYSSNHYLATSDPPPTVEAADVESYRRLVGENQFELMTQCPTLKKPLRVTAARQ